MTPSPLHLMLVSENRLISYISLEQWKLNSSVLRCSHYSWPLYSCSEDLDM